MNKPLMIGIAGGSGSGKSTVTQELIDLIGAEKVTLIQQDSYYKDQSHLPLEERMKTNYDNPLSFDEALLVAHLKDLKMGKTIQIPQYDYTVHNRKKDFIELKADKIIILEGILILAEESIRDLLDIKVFVDTDADVRIIRRILRDIKERSRSLESIILQYMSTVRPAHLQFVEPSKRYADIIIPEGGYNKVAIDLLVTKIKNVLSQGE